MATREERKKIEYENKITNIMDKLNVTRAEAEDVIKHDEIIDKGGRTEHDFDKAKEKECMKMCNTGQKKKAPTVYNFTKRERKENTTKSGIIAELARFLAENGSLLCENIEIIKKEKLISFTVGENSYELDLKQKRKPKTE